MRLVRLGMFSGMATLNSVPTTSGPTVRTPEDPDRLDELIPVAERSVDSITFEAP